MMSWRGGSHLTVFWSVKVRPLSPLIVLSKAALSQFLILSVFFLFYLLNSPPLGPANLGELPSGLL